MRYHYPYSHSNPLYTGNIVAVHTTPPSIVIRPEYGGASVTATGFSPIQLENLLKGLSLGAAQVTYTLRLTPFGWYAENVHSTGFVDEERWRWEGFNGKGALKQAEKGRGRGR